MNQKIVIIMLMLTPTAFAGTFVQKNPYTNAHFAVGAGKTYLSARSDAQSAIPLGSKLDFYEPDSNFNSSVVQCTNELQWTEISECEGADVQYVIPLRHVTR